MKDTFPPPFSSEHLRTPGSLGYRMPAEWEPHAATWLAWPHNRDSWPGKFEPVPAAFVEIIKHLCGHELVNISVNDEETRSEVTSLLKRSGIPPAKVQFHIIPTNDAWTRDHGPIFVIRESGDNREAAIVDWEYNAWGGKYPPFDLDNQVPSRIAEILNVPVFRPRMVLEGGSIDVNGKGALMTTESCLLNPNRNPSLSKPEIEQRLKDYLGVSNVLWLGDGIKGDDTDGHIDDLARFVAPSTVVAVVEDDPADENYLPLRDNLARLRAMKDQDGRPLEVLTLPMPPRMEHQGQRLPASYANFYIANNVVLVPTFNCVEDKTAIDALQRLFPDRQAIGIYCKDLVWGLGAIHCATQQQPAARRQE